MPEANFTFRLLGRVNGFWALRAPTWSTSCRKATDAQRFEAQVNEWLLNEADGDAFAGNGPMDNHPLLPGAFSTGSGHCVIIQRTDDLIRFGERFCVSGLDPEALSLQA